VSKAGLAGINLPVRANVPQGSLLEPLAPTAVATMKD
jgi:hypothetical protein